MSLQAWFKHNNYLFLWTYSPILCRFLGVGFAVRNDHDVCLCLSTRICVCHCGMQFSLQFLLPPSFSILYWHLLIFMQNNITEIRTDAFKLLTMLKRPAPNASTTIGAWFQIFQVLQVIRVYWIKLHTPRCVFHSLDNYSHTNAIGFSLKITVSDSDVNSHQFSSSSMVLWLRREVENRTWPCCNPRNGTCSPAFQIRILTLCSWGNFILHLPFTHLTEITLHSIDSAYWPLEVVFVFTMNLGGL